MVNELNFMATYNTNIFSGAVKNGEGKTELIGFTARYNGLCCSTDDRNFLITDKDRKIKHSGNCSSFEEGKKKIAEYLGATIGN